MKKYLLLLSSLWAALLISGCGTTQPARHYMLQPIDPDPTDQPVSSADIEVSVGLLPIELPSHLNRKQLVSRLEGTEMKIHKYALWAEPMQDSVLRILATDLTEAMPNVLVDSFPWSEKSRMNYSIMIEFSRLEFMAEKGATLEARWSLYGGDLAPEDLVTRQSTRIDVKSVSDKPADMVYAMSEALSRMAAEMAELIQQEIDK